MSNVLKMAAVGGAVSAETDPNFKQTVLLLHGDGTNGAQNNTFLDSSTNNFTITRNGNTTQGTFSPFSAEAGKWSNYFDGTGDYLSLTGLTAVGTSDVTIEFWFYPTSSSVAYRGLFDSRSTTGTNTGFGILQYGRTIEIYGNGLKVASAADAFNINEWTHFAVTRSSGTCQIYINGVASGSSATYSDNLTSTVVKIGDTVNTLFPFVGYISNLRVVNGTVITPSAGGPTSPLTTVSGTELLTCQSNLFVDNSTNAFAITRNGDVKVTPFSPFAPSAAYSPSVNGGSGYFDGSGDRLEIADNAALELAGSDFCVEAWIYPTATPGASGGIIIQKLTTTYPAGYEFNFNLSSSRYAVFGFYTSSQFTLTGTTALPLNAWHHVAAVRSGSNFALFVNGVREATDTTAGSIQTTASSVYIGDYPAGGRPLTGNIANVRMVKGSSVYDPTQTTITVPTAPLTAITNTSLLCNFTNAGILDNTGKNVLETIGNAQIDTTTKKYGLGSMKFDGTGDYLQSAAGNPDFDFGTGDFTIEFWMYANSTTGGVSGFGTTGSVTGGTSLQHDVIFVTNNLRFRIMTGSTITTVASPSVSTATWTHFALVREGSTFTVYKDGVSEGTATNSGSLNFNTSWVWRVGSGVGSGTTFFDGYIDDLRIIKGVARYTANFTVPTKAFPDQ